MNLSKKATIILQNAQINGANIFITKEFEGYSLQVGNHELFKNIQIEDEELLIKIALSELEVNGLTESKNTTEYSLTQRGYEVKI